MAGRLAVQCDCSNALVAVTALMLWLLSLQVPPLIRSLLSLLLPPTASYCPAWVVVGGDVGDPLAPSKPLITAFLLAHAGHFEALV